MPRKKADVETKQLTKITVNNKITLDAKKRKGHSGAPTGRKGKKRGKRIDPQLIPRIIPYVPPMNPILSGTQATVRSLPQEVSRTPTNLMTKDEFETLKRQVAATDRQRSDQLQNITDSLDLLNFRTNNIVNKLVEKQKPPKGLNPPITFSGTKTDTSGDQRSSVPDAKSSAKKPKSTLLKFFTPPKFMTPKKKTPKDDNLATSGQAQNASGGGAGLDEAPPKPRRIRLEEFPDVKPEEGDADDVIFEEIDTGAQARPSRLSVSDQKRWKEAYLRYPTYSTDRLLDELAWYEENRGITFREGQKKKYYVDLLRRGWFDLHFPDIPYEEPNL